ncbi:hypothetical protein D3C80_1655840 [compost metagenome]
MLLLQCVANPATHRCANHGPLDRIGTVTKRRADRRTSRRANSQADTGTVNFVVSG